MTNDLIAFLNARLNEVERLARDALEEPDAPRETWYPYPDRLARCLYDARHDPARVLRDVEADRRLLAEWLKAEADPAIDDQWNAGLAAGLRLAVQIRTARYGDHPDYREEWKP